MAVAKDHNVLHGSGDEVVEQKLFFLFIMRQCSVGWIPTVSLSHKGHSLSEV